MGKNMLANVRDIRDVGLIPGSGRSPGEGNGYPLQYFFLENSMDTGAWRATTHEAAKTWTWLEHAAPTSPQRVQAGRSSCISHLHHLFPLTFLKIWHVSYWKQVAFFVPTTLHSYDSISSSKIDIIFCICFYFLSF